MPKRVVKQRKDGHVRAEDEDDDTLLLDQMPKSSRTESLLRATPSTLVGSSTSKLKSAEKMDVDEGSETESDSDQEEISEGHSERAPKARKDTRLPSPIPSEEGEDEELRAPGRIISLAHPLADFEKNIKQGDLVTKAVEDLAWAIRTVVMKPFASRREEEMLKCMKELRSVCLNVRECSFWVLIELTARSGR